MQSEQPGKKQKKEGRIAEVRPPRGPRPAGNFRSQMGAATLRRTMKGTHFRRLHARQFLSCLLRTEGEGAGGLTLAARSNG